MQVVRLGLLCEPFCDLDYRIAAAANHFLNDLKMVLERET